MTLWNAWRRSLLRGAASALDLRGNTHRLYRPSDGPESDAKAIRDDWQRVGDDMRRALNQAAGS